MKYRRKYALRFIYVLLYSSFGTRDGVAGVVKCVMFVRWDSYRPKRVTFIKYTAIPTLLMGRHAFWLLLSEKAVPVEEPTDGKTKLGPRLVAASTWY